MAIPRNIKNTENDKDGPVIKEMVDFDDDDEDSVPGRPMCLILEIAELI